MEDNLEKFFNKHMNEEVPKEDWNTPSQDIFGNAMFEVNKKKPRNRSILFLWLANGILLAGLLYALIYISLLKDKTSNIESNFKEQIENNSSKSNEPTSNPTALYESNNINNTDTNSKKQISSQDLNENSIGSVKNTIIKNQNNIKSISKTQNNNHPEKYSSIDISTIYLKNKDLLNQKDKNNNVSKIPNLNNNKTNIGKDSFKINTLQKLLINPFYNQKTKLNSFNLLKNIKTFDSKKKLKSNNNILGIYIASTLTAAPMMGEIPADYSTLVGSSDLLLSYEFGAEYSRRIYKKLYLKTGLTFRRIKFWSQSEISDTYDKSTEFINQDGDVENIQSFGIPTALGFINTDLHMTHPIAMIIDQGEKIDATVHLTQHLYYLNIPLGLEYYQSIGSKTNITAGIGLSWNKIVGYENLFDPILSHKGNEMGYVDLNSASMNVSNSFNYYLSVGGTYSIKNNFDLYIGAKYFRNIDSIYETGKMRTKIHGFSLKIGSNYIF